MKRIRDFNEDDKHAYRLGFLDALEAAIRSDHQQIVEMLAYLRKGWKLPDTIPARETD